MAHAIAFDTFSYAKELKKAGFTEIQVDTQVKFVKEQTDAINDFIDNSIATKQDIKELELKLTIKLVSILGGIIVFCAGASTAAYSYSN